MIENQVFRCGYIAIIGRPNVGKSTLLNRILGHKLSITSRKPQTTRHRIVGIKTSENYQAIYVDTPGLHLDRQRAINRYMNRTAVSVVTDVDVLVFVVEALHWTKEDAYARNQLGDSRLPVILAVNKVDRVSDKGRLLPYLEEVSQRAEFAEVIPLSARRGHNVNLLEALAVRRLPVGEAIFHNDQMTDRSERFLASELIREKLTRKLGQEIPYRLSVNIEVYSDHDDLLKIGAVIWVERTGQKAIVIGKEGQVLKAVGVQARQDMESLFGKRVFLQLWVKVKAGWSDDERVLHRMGYGD